MDTLSGARGESDLVEPPAPTEDAQSDRLRALLGVLRRRWLVMLPAAMVVFALSYVSAALSPRIYAATAVVLINPGRVQVIDSDQLVNQTSPTWSVVQSEIQVLRSPTMMRRVVDALRLEEDAEWNGALRRPTGLAALLAPLNRRQVQETAPAAPANQEGLRDRIARGLARTVTVERQEESYAIALTAHSRSPRRAAEIANSLAQAYLDYQVEAQFTATESANRWLTERVRELATDVQDKERAAEAFRREAGLSAAAGGQDQALQSEDVQTMLVTARADLTEKEARLRQVERLIRAGGSADLIAGAANSPLITELRSREAELERRQADLEQRYGELHPLVQNGQTELDSLRERIDAEIGRITTTLRNEVEVARNRLSSLQGNFGAVSGSFSSDDEAVIQYRQLLREAQAARTVHQSYLQRFEEVESQRALPLTTARLVSNAVPPGAPSSPDLSGAFRRALLLALALGLGLGFLIEFLDNTVSGADEVERKVGAPAIASVPKLRQRSDYRLLAPDQQHPAGYLVEKPMSAFAEAFRVLRTSIVHARLDAPVRVLAVCSAVPDEGKTTVSLCLARIAAMSGQSVIVVDCDLRRQSVGQVLGVAPVHGLLEVLRGEADWRGAVVRDRETSAQFLVGAPASFTPLDVFSSRAMHDLVAQLRHAYDLVIFDCAPVLAVAETRVAAAHADTALLVVRAEKTPASASKTAIRELRKAGVHVHGVALNCVTPRGSSYADSLYYGYAKQKYYAA